MNMKFLCLHGRGTSGQIFKSQTSSFRRLLPESYEFEFVDGQYPGSAAPGVDLFFDPPYFQHYSSRTLVDIENSRQWLLQYIKDHGPYDGVMSFSEGCALLSSLLLYHQSHNPSTEPPFKVAIFICGGVPLDMISDLGVNVPFEARRLDERSRLQLQAQASTEAILREGTQRWGAGYDDLAGSDKSSVFGFDFGKIPQETLIQIPTVHIYGSKDPRFPAGVVLANFCEESMRKVLDHGGGHEIPRRIDVSERIAKLVEWCGMMAEG